MLTFSSPVTKQLHTIMPSWGSWSSWGDFAIDWMFHPNCCTQSRLVIVLGHPLAFIMLGICILEHVNFYQLQKVRLYVYSFYYVILNLPGQLARDWERGRLGTGAAAGRAPWDPGPARLSGERGGDPVQTVLTQRVLTHFMLPSLGYISVYLVCLLSVLGSQLSRILHILSKWL